MISEKAVEAAAREAVRFTLHKAPDGVRIFKDGERFEGPWGYHEMDAAELALASHQFRAALSAALPLLLDEIAREATYIVEQTELTMTGQTSRLNTIEAAAERIIAYGKG